MSSLREIVKADLYRHEGLSGYSGLIEGWFKPGFRYTLLFRLVWGQHKASPFHFLLRLLKRRYRLKYGFEIDLNAEIGEGFYLSDHVGPVVIGPIKIGKHCNVSHNVTIVRSYKNGEIGRPTIGDRVWIGPGAVIVGRITIGSNVMIAPNAFINFDVPDYAVVIGNPGQIILKQNPTRYYINYILGEKKDLSLETSHAI
jgi:serine O-acetyltransferase